jgi:hypothetical protein
MATTQTIIEKAYNRSTGFDPGIVAEDAELIAELDALYQSFYALYARSRPKECTTTMSIELQGNPAKQIMAPVPIDVLFIFNEDQHQVHLIPATERERTWHMAPCVYQNGSWIISRMHGGDPVACDILELTVLDTPVTLTALTTLIDPRFPLRNHRVLVDGLALYLSAKDEGRDPGEHAKIVQGYTQALGAFASEYDLDIDAQEWMHAPVKRQKAVGPS